MESLSEMFWDCFKQLSVKLDKHLKESKQEIMCSKD